MKNGYTKGVAGWIAGRQREPRRIEQDYRRVRAALRSLGRGVTFLVAWSVPMAALAAEASLAWDGVAHPEVTGYYLHYGMASRGYSNRIPVGNVTSYTVSSLVSGQRYYFAVTAHNAELAESHYSNEVSTVVAGVAASMTTLASSPSPSAVGASVTFAATVTGNAPGGTVAFLGWRQHDRRLRDGNADRHRQHSERHVHSVRPGGRDARCHCALHGRCQQCCLRERRAYAHRASLDAGRATACRAASGSAWMTTRCRPARRPMAREPWDWVSNSPAPFAGRLAHQSWPSRRPAPALVHRSDRYLSPWRPAMSCSHTSIWTRRTRPAK